MTALTADAPNDNASKDQNLSKATAPALNDLEKHFLDHMRGVNAMILDRLTSEIALIPQIAAYLIAAGGKRIRPLLTLAAASFAENDAIDHSYGFATAVEFIHTATLLHDDVVDDSDQRRGKKSANLVFGNQATVLVGDYLFSKSFELMVDGGNLEALRMLSSASATIAEGEVMQLNSIGDMSLTIDYYLKIIECKTAALFRAATKSGAIITRQPTASQDALYDYGHHLGMCFQLADDMIDYTSTSAKMGKKTGDDFREGKLTLPIILAIQHAAEHNNESEQAFWIRCFKDKDQNEGDFDQARLLIETYDIISVCKAYCLDYANNAKQALQRLPHTEVRDMMERLIDDVINRAA